MNKPALNNVFVDLHVHQVSSDRRLRPPSSRVWVEISIDKIVANFRKIRARVHPCEVMAVLKANAYGLGVPEIAKALKAAGVFSVGVAEVREALMIKDLGVPVQILGALIKDEVPAVVEYNIVAPISDRESAQLLSDEAVRQRKPVECHYLVDTGMGRLGILWKEAVEVVRETRHLPGLTITGICTHFPHAYEDCEFSSTQIRRFYEILKELENAGTTFSWIHSANSDGVNNVPESTQPPFNLVRTGINLYGAFDLEGLRAYELEPVLTLKTRLAAKRQLPAGTTIGYGRTYVTERDMTVGTVSIGYADGVPLAMSNNGSFSVRGKPCPILGRVSMDYTTISLESVPDAEVGDEVICLGGECSVADWARKKNSITYDIICSLGNRVERRYV